MSSDKDMLQLVNDRVRMLNPMKDDLWYDAAKVEQFMGVKPVKLPICWLSKAIRVDNIPGAPGIGDKGAKDLITASAPWKLLSTALPKSSARCIARACRIIATRFC